MSANTAIRLGSQRPEHAVTNGSRWADGARLRILVHDFAGHPFQVQLSRELARRGHSVLHLYAAGVETPHGQLARKQDDVPALAVESLGQGLAFKKYALVERWRWERSYGRLLAARIQAFRPHVVLSGNTPLEAQAMALRETRSSGAAFIYWLQDLLSVGIGRAVRDRIPVAGRLVGRYYTRLERRLLEQSDAVVSISEDFTSTLQKFHVRDDRLHVIENWAPLEELPVSGKHNIWAEHNGFEDKLCFVYAGTLGLKHNPGLLVELARRFSAQPDVAVIVVSQGLGADWLCRQKGELSLENLYLFPFQDYEDLPLVLGSGDILVTILEPEAGRFSVPSKVLSYLCAGRPLLGAIPPENLAARVIERARAGVAVSPLDRTGFLEAAATLAGDAALRERLGEAGRRYAEAHFDVNAIADRFEQVIGPAVARVEGLSRGGAAHGS